MQVAGGVGGHGGGVRGASPAGALIVVRLSYSETPLGRRFARGSSATVPCHPEPGDVGNQRTDAASSLRQLRHRLPGQSG